MFDLGVGWVGGSSNFYTWRREVILGGSGVGGWAQRKIDFRPPTLPMNLRYKYPSTGTWLGELIDVAPLLILAIWLYLRPPGGELILARDYSGGGNQTAKWYG